MTGTAIVCGAGTGGLAAALALHRTGWEVHVLERRTNPLAGGTALVLSPNALAVLDALGVGGQVRTLGSAVGTMSLRRPDGSRLTRPAPAGTPLRCLRRADLSALLAAALPAGTLRTGTTVTGAHPGGPGRPALVRTTTATTTATSTGTTTGTLTADLVVAADGIASPLRALVDPDAIPRSAGYSAWRALAEDLPGPLGGASETWGHGERVGAVPLGPTAAYVYATAPAAPGDGAGTDLRTRFSGWHDPLPALLDAAGPWHHDRVAALPAVPRLHTGRLVLLGDAAHALEPNLGQGACLALEDAAVLAHHLSAAHPGGDVGAALAAYDRERRPRVAALLARSRQVGRLTLLRTPLAVAARDAALRLTPARLASRQAAGIWSWRPAPGFPHPRAATTPGGR
ncbi:FAD-dependent monooxygenase [Kineococcus sp. NUM-3379]